MKGKLGGVLLAVAGVALLAAIPTATADTPGTFAPTGSMTVQRSEAAAAPLPDGRVLVAGGSDGGGNVLQGAEIFNPATGTFTQTGTMTVKRRNAAAAPLPGGRVLVAGGANFEGGTNFLQSAEIFDPATGGFAPTGPMTVKRQAAAAAPLPDGRVLVAGGFDGGNFLQSAEIFNPATGTFTPTGSMAVKRYFFTAAPLADGRVLVAGGQYFDGSGSHILESAEIFNPATADFSPTGSMAVKREGPAASPLPDGRVLVAGGFDSNPLESAEIFNPATGSFPATTVMAFRRDRPAAAPLPDGRVLVAGGFDGANVLQSAETFALAPRAQFKFGVRGKRLIFTAPVVGTVSVADVAAKSGALAAAKKKRKPGLRPSSASGGPGKITVALRLAGKAKQRFKATGRAKVRAKITFTPTGQCVRFFRSCYDAGTETTKLKVKKGKKK
jgi:Kelch motif